MLQHPICTFRVCYGILAGCTAVRMNRFIAFPHRGHLPSFFLFCKQLRRQVSIARIRQQYDDVLARKLWTLRQLNGCCQGRT